MKTLLIREVSDKLHKQFKTKCAEEGVSMTEKVKELIEAWLREE